MYPSREFEKQCVTNRAGIYTAGPVLIFLFASIVFLWYDYHLVEIRQKEMARRLSLQIGNVAAARDGTPAVDADRE